MNHPASSNPFRPKQALAPTPALYDELVSDGMINLAKASIAELPPFTNDSTIHDNGCGTGAGTSAIVSSLSDTSTKISIKGTDINKDALATYEKNIKDGDWPAESVHMDSTTLTFDDNTFSHSLSSGLIFILPSDGINAVKEIHRTLKPGGTAIINSWAHTPNMIPIQTTSMETRPAGTPLPRQGSEKWSAPDFLLSVMEQGGFVREKIRVEQKEVSVTVPDFDKHVEMVWSFIGGTGEAGWLESDEEKWDEALGILKRELSKSEGFELLDGGSARLRFVANVGVGVK